MSNIPGAFGKPFNCPCCKNPWNQSEGGEGSSAGAIFCTPCLVNDKGFKGINPANFDHSISPKDNFYYWSNGGWMKENPIPLEYSSWNTFIVLRDLNLDRLKTILDELAATSNEKTAKLADYYASFMDEATIDERGTSVLAELLNDCGNFPIDPTGVTARLHAKYGVHAFFSAHSSPDKSNSEHSLCALYQGGLGLPDRDYYFDADKAEKRVKYVTYIASLFRLLGASNAAHADLAQYADESYALAAARTVLEVETRIAGTHLTRTASRDPLLTFSKMTHAELVKRSAPPLTWSTYLAHGAAPPTKFDWVRYFAAIGKPAEALGDLNVASVSAITGLSAILDDFAGTHALVHYLRFHSVNSFAGHLPAAFADAQFDFFEKELKGTVQQLPRWKRALQGLESALGEELGQLYVAKYFPADAKQRALEVVEAVRDALRERLLEVEWMSEQTRQEAMIKMEKFKVKIGFPDQWLDYSAMKITRGKHFENILAARQYAHALEQSRMNAPTDKARWFMTPQTVNAYYHPSLNEIVFPAAILQPPFFDPGADAAVQFGSLGAVVGHEMTHGFDDQGRKYDSAGNLRDWWAGSDGPEYEKRADVMIKQAANFEVHGLKLNGKLTCGENIADLGGVKLSLRALQRHLAAEKAANGGLDAPLINGFTPEQRLFLAWSQAWRENVKKERAIQLVTLDPHGPNEMRCNGTLSNVPEFLEAFGITEGDKMYLSPEQRVDIW